MTTNGARALTVRVSGSGRNVGKTTLATRLMSWLSDRGLRVSAVKRTHHSLPADDPGSDTDLMARAGAARVAFVGPEGVVERSGATSLEEVVARLSVDADVVIVEGYRDQPLDLQLHLTGTPPARVEVTVRETGASRVVTADDLEVIGELAERLLAEARAG